VILSSHLLADVEDVCDRVVIYYGGRVQAKGELRQLLAKPDALRITTPVLPRETLERALEILRRDVGGDAVRIDTPTQNLESYFLGVVERAKQVESTSGAISGARVAAYLRGGAESAPARTDRVLDRLTQAATAEAPRVSVSAPEPAVDEARLAALAGAKPVEPVPPVSVAKPAPANLDAANDKLSDLLGGKP
jgi:ABC-2 type transport system ATP-binding protein